VNGVIFGLDGLFVLLIGLVGLVLPIWALVDAISRPTGAFTAAGSFWLFTGIVGVVLSVVYLASIRPRVRGVMP
jgi:hypothetical protein